MTVAIAAPASLEDLAEAVAEAAHSGTPLEPVGHGSRQGLGRPVRHRRLDLSRLSGVTLYEPEELVLTAHAGTPIGEIAALLEAHGQELAFEPQLRNLVHEVEGGGTIGGLYMTNLSGPRRIKAGALRDHALGLTAVSGRGEIFKAGGRVVKNVTGYDLPKALTGSYGTLAIAAAITLKVLPKAEAEATLLLEGLDDCTAIARLCAAMGTPTDVSGAVHLPAPAARRLGFQDAVTLLRLEGVLPSVNARFETLVQSLDLSPHAERIETDASRRLWADLRDGAAAKGRAGDIVWRISVAPTMGPGVAAAIHLALDAEIYYDWSGGLIFAMIRPEEEDGGATIIRAAVRNVGGGHATLIRAPDELRSRIPVFEPQPAPLAALARRLHEAFDPAGILNPGRMVEGI